MKAVKEWLKKNWAILVATFLALYGYAIHSGGDLSEAIFGFFSWVFLAYWLFYRLGRAIRN